MPEAIIQDAETGQEINRVPKQCFDWLCPYCYGSVSDNTNNDNKEYDKPQWFYLGMPFYSIEAVKLRKRKHIEHLRHHVMLLGDLMKHDAIHLESMDTLEASLHFTAQQLQKEPG